MGAPIRRSAIQPSGINPTVGARATAAGGPSPMDPIWGSQRPQGPTSPTAGNSPTWAENPGPGMTPTQNNGAFTQNLSTTGRMSAATLQAGQEAQQGRNQYEQMLGQGQNALNTMATAAMNAAMPNFDAQLQQLNESAQRRGISNGGLSTSYQGDLASAMQKNIANAVGAQALGLYGTQLGSVQNQMNTDFSNYGSGLQNAYDIAQSRKSKKSGLFGGIGGALGGILGNVGGPIGSIFGDSVGSSLGAALGGAFGS